MFTNSTLRVPILTNEQGKCEEEQLPIRFDLGVYKEKISTTISRKLTKNNDFEWILSDPNDAYIEQVANETNAVNESNAAKVAEVAKAELEVIN